MADAPTRLTTSLADCDHLSSGRSGPPSRSARSDKKMLELDPRPERTEVVIIRNWVQQVRARTAARN